jgi:hypothetical protein
MTKHLSATGAGGLALTILLLALSAAAPAVAEPVSPRSCTPRQVRSPEGVRCVALGEKDLLANSPSSHVLFCDQTSVRCCITTPNKYGGYSTDSSKCGPTIALTPEEPVLVCAEQKAEKGVWKPDPKTIKANADRKTCSQVYTCTPPPADNATLKLINIVCAPVIASSHKQVTQNGTCVPVPGSKDPACSSCLANPPNESCNVTFRKK